MELTLNEIKLERGAFPPLAFTCSQSTIEKQKKGVDYV